MCVLESACSSPGYHVANRPRTAHFICLACTPIHGVFNTLVPECTSRSAQCGRALARGIPALRAGEAAAQAWQWQQAAEEEEAARRPLSADAARWRSPTRLQHFSRWRVVLWVDAVGNLSMSHALEGLVAPDNPRHICNIISLILKGYRVWHEPECLFCAARRATSATSAACWPSTMGVPCPRAPAAPRPTSMRAVTHGRTRSCRRSSSRRGWAGRRARRGRSTPSR